MSASSVPPKAVYTGRPLPSRGSSGVSSPRSSVLSADSDCSSALPPHFVAFAWRYLASCRLRAHPSGTPRVVDPGPFVRRRPHRLSRKERMSPPRFLDDPFVYMPCSLTPVGSTDPTHSARTLLSSAFPNTSTPHFQLSRLCHTACTPPVYASQPRSPWYHATLGSGGGSALPVRDLHPTGHNERFPVVSFLDTLSSSPRLCLAHGKR